jgi:3-oxoacyl-[acyl-carrier protein] reductase
MDLGLDGRRVLVTGGTKGIGRAIAEMFAAEGAAVAICARDKSEVEATTAELARKGRKTFGAAIDVSDGLLSPRGSVVPRRRWAASTLSFPM